MPRPRKKADSKRRAPGEGSIYQRQSDGIWIGVMDVPTVDGSRRQKRVYSMDYGKCVVKLDELKDAIKDGVVPNASTTVERWMTYWLTEIKGPHVRPNTAKFYEESIRLHIAPAIGKKRLDRLTPQDVRMMLKSIKTGRNKQRAHQVLGLALKAAVKDGELRRNVVEAVEKPDHLAAVRGAFTAEQAKLILRTSIAVEESRDATADPALATRWAAAFLSGARKGELLGLTWDRVDLEAGLFDFAWQLQQLTKVHGCGTPDGDTYPCRRQRPSFCPQAHWDFEDGYEYRECHRSLLWTRPKSQAGTRVVPIVPPLLELLRRHAALPGPNPLDLVWHHVDGRPLSPKDDHEAWQALLRTAGITQIGETIPLHSARHTTATLLQAAGVDESTRMQIMGQSSAAAQRMYVHVEQTQTRAALGNLTALLG